MRISFACPSCGATGTVNVTAAGQSARCKHCGNRFTIPSARDDPAEAAEIRLEGTRGDEYALVDPQPISAFVPTRGEEPAAGSPRRPKRSTPPSTPPTGRRDGPRIAWWKWLAGTGSAAAISIAGVALFVPDGLLIAACAVILIGCVLILVGFVAGAYGAFSEDFLYGFFYVVIPLYTAYYMVTRWDDLWVWFACMTSGVGLIFVGAELARWGGIVV